MKRFLLNLYQLVILLAQSSQIGYGQTPNPPQANSQSNEQNTDFLYGRAVCERFNENMTSSEVVVCDDGYKDCFTTALISDKGEVHVIAKGCWLLPKSEEGLCTKRACLFGMREGIGEGTKRTCCCRGFSCNKNSTYVRLVLVPKQSPTAPPTVLNHKPAREHKMPRPGDISRKETIIFGVISSVFATFLILSIVFVSWRCAARKNKLLLASVSQLNEKAVEEMVEYSTISTDDVTFGDLIHKGRFSSLWRAECNGRKAVFKIYKPENFLKWRKEKRTYDMIGCHPNIVEFIDGVELCGSKSGKAIVLEYYPCGSLRTYLSSNVLTWGTMYNLILSLANGVAYMHGEIDEYDHLKRKVIVHRNLNSSNVLLKNDGSCALSDFETAVRVTGKQILPMAEGASIRYMPPEVLCCKVNWNDWESSLKQADIYSLGLIFWEIVRKCADFYADNKKPPDAALPYQMELGNNPSATQVIQHTVKERKRPVFPQALGLSDKSDSLLRSTIEECWDTEPEARLTALCVVKRMQEIHNIKNSVTIADEDSEPFIEVSPCLTSRSKEREEYCGEEISLHNLPIDDNNSDTAVPCTCVYEASLKERLINSDQGHCNHSEEC